MPLSIGMTDGKRIIVIDPAAEATQVLAERLRMQGYQVTVAHDPSEGARLSLSNPPAAVIADLWMPGISGVQLCRLLGTEPATEGVPVILRGPEGPRNHFWAERAGAVAYVVRGRMGDLVRALAQAIARAPPPDGFFTTLSGGENDVRERIAARLDAALFESVIASEVRALGTCGEFDRLFDLFSQFVARVTAYRWLAISTEQPPRFGLHANPSLREIAEREARAILKVDENAIRLIVEDEDAFDDQDGPPPIIAPIRLGDISIGTLALAPRQSATTQDEELVAVIAREIGSPIRMAALVEESRRLATIDALTGLMNRRAFNATLQAEMARAERYNLPLSFLLLDVDHFKAINDQRGHAGGDVVLSALGRLLSKRARTTDQVARWGGEEFVVALTCTEAKGAQVYAERLRQAVEELHVEDGEGRPIPVTASFGLASYEPGESLESLIDRADRAMYAAKSDGRNRVAATPSKTVETAEITETSVLIKNGPRLVVQST